MRCCIQRIGFSVDMVVPPAAPMESPNKWAAALWSSILNIPTWVHRITNRSAAIGWKRDELGGPEGERGGTLNQLIMALPLLKTSVIESSVVRAMYKAVSCIHLSRGFPLSSSVGHTIPRSYPSKQHHFFSLLLRVASNLRSFSTALPRRSTITYSSGECVFHNKFFSAN